MFNDAASNGEDLIPPLWARSNKEVADSTRAATRMAKSTTPTVSEVTEFAKTKANSSKRPESDNGILGEQDNSVKSCPKGVAKSSASAALAAGTI